LSSGTFRSGRLDDLYRETKAELAGGTSGATGGESSAAANGDAAERLQFAAEFLRWYTVPDGWLSPIADDDAPRAARGANCAAGSTGRRASDRGFLPLGLDEYLKLLDWTGRQLRRGQRGAIPQGLRPILERLRIKGDSWLDSVRHFGRWFHRAAGRAGSLASAADRAQRRWFQGTGSSRLAFN